MMNLRKLVSRKALVVVSLLLFAFLIQSTDLNAVAIAVSRANPAYIFLSLAAAACSVGFKTLRWLALLREKRGVSFQRLFAVQASGLAVSNLSPGKLLEPFKVIPLRKDGFSYSFLVTSVFWERAFDLVILFALSLGALSTLDSRLAPVLQLGLLALAAAVFVMFRKSAGLFKLLSHFGPLRFFEKIEAHNFKKRSLLASFVLTWFAWLCDFAGIYFAFLALGTPIDFAKIATSFSSAVLFGIVTLLPGGFGSTEAALVALLATPAYTASQVIAGVFLGRACTVGFTTAGGFALLPTVKKE